MKKFLYVIVMLAALGGIVYYITSRVPEVEKIDEPEAPLPEYISYKSSEYGPEFTYPSHWGKITFIEGNTTCPEEYGYRTQDSLNTFEWEYSFAEIKLPGSESFIRTGIRTHEIDPENMNECGDDFLFKIARKEIQPETLSSVQLNSVTNKSGLSGTYNREASRLNTESRMQYTFFLVQELAIYVIQPYMSFVPHFGSPELAELEGQYKGDMSKYIASGTTAAPIRKYFEEFQNMSDSVKFVNVD